MARASAMIEDEQVEMFPELDTSKPKQKLLLKESRRFAKMKADRDALLSNNKEKVDAQMDKVVALMHENGMSKFRHEGVTVEVFTRKEKVLVKIAGDSDDGHEE